MSSRSYSKNEVIFRQGDDAQEMFDILSGSVGVYVNYGKENETQLTVLKPGCFLGEMGLIENYPRSATAVAMEDGTCLQVIDDAEFSSYFQGQPERLLEIMRQISARLRDRTEDYKAACLIRDEMIGSNPEKRSKTLGEKIKSILGIWNDEMKDTDPDVMQYFAFFNGGTYYVQYSCVSAGRNDQDKD